MPVRPRARERPAGPGGVTPLWVFYDAECLGCRNGVSWLLRRDRRRALRAVPAQSADARDAVGSERAARLLDELHTYHATQGVRTGVDALAAILSRLQGWRWAGWLLGLPPVRQLARPVYHWVARHRYLLGRHSGQACSRRARR